MQYLHEKLGVVTCLDNYMVSCSDYGGLTCLYEVVVEYLDNNNKDNFDVDFLHAHPLEYILKENLGGKYLVHHTYMQKIGCCETHVHFCYHQNYKN